MRDVLTLILGGGRGARLYPLTKHRSEPAVPLAGSYRLIDIPLSSCLNSGFNRIYVLTQFLSVSLHRHISQTYKFDPFSRGFVEILAAQQTNEECLWYRGTADAVRQHLRYIEADPAENVLLLSGDQLYRMDFQHLLATHRLTQADLTIAVFPVARQRAANLGLVRLDDAGRLVELVEKPQTDEQLRPLRLPPEWLESRGSERRGRDYLANMGIYLFRRQVLCELLQQHLEAMDLVLEIFPRCLKTHRIRTHLFDGYWEDLGTIKTYYEASLSLTEENPPFNFHRSDNFIYTRMRYLPASRISAAQMEGCLVGDGCVVQPETEMKRCVLGIRSRVGRNVRLRDTILLGADRFETEAERAANRKRGIPDFGIGDGCVIERAILDKDCRIGQNVRIVNQRNVQDDEGDNYAIREGIVVIPNGAVVPDGTVI
jgi:glucose-1-phosphate adenylyltransferase